MITNVLLFLNIVKYFNICLQGSMHDSRVFHESDLFELINDHWYPNNLPFEGAVILGDSAYQVQKLAKNPSYPINM